MSKTESIQNRVIAMLLACFVLTKLCNAQYINRIYSDDRPLLVFSSVIEENGSYSIIGGTYGTAPNIGKVWLSKLNDAGDMLVSYIYDDSVNASFAVLTNAFIKTSDGNFAFTGYSYDSQAYLLFGKANKTLDTVTLYRYYTPNTYAYHGYSLVQVDNYYYITGVRTLSSPQNANVVLVKIDSAGNRLWERMYDQEKYDRANSIISLANGNLLLGAEKNDLNQTIQRANTWLLEVDTGGTVQRQWFDINDSSYVAQGLRQTSDGGFIYGAQKKMQQSINDVYFTGIVVKVDSDFNKKWTFNVGVMGNVTGITDVELLPDGNYIASGNYSNKFGLVVKLTSDGDLLWERKYEGITDGNAAWNILSDIDILADGSFVAVGQCQRLVNPNQLPPQIGWFLKLDSNGCEIENCLVGVESIIQNYETREIQVYPNPFTSDVSIALTGGYTSTANFTITNITGQVVYQQVETNLAPGYTKMLDLSYLPNGVYFVEVTTIEGKVVKRVVKQ